MLKRCSHLQCRAPVSITHHWLSAQPTAIEDTGNSKFQFSLSWDAVVDLDIHLVTPQGICSYQNRNIAGAELDVDRMPKMNSKSWDTLPVENIVCDNAFPGTYICKVVQCRAQTTSSTRARYTL